MDIITEHTSFFKFQDEVNELLLQLRLFKIGEIRFYQLFQITSVTRQITFLKHEIAIGSSGDFKLTDNEVKELSNLLHSRYQCNGLSELAIKNFNVVYNLPDGRHTIEPCVERNNSNGLFVF